MPFRAQQFERLRVRDVKDAGAPDCMTFFECPWHSDNKVVVVREGEHKTGDTFGKYFETTVDHPLLAQASATFLPRYWSLVPRQWKCTNVGSSAHEDERRGRRQGEECSLGPAFLQQFW